MSAGAGMTASRIAVRPVSPAIGAQVDCGDVKRLDADTFAEVHRAFLDHLVLLIRGQSLTVPDLLAFGRRFGPLSPGAPVHIGQKPRDEI
jgi:taurine dioxygenase